MPSEVKSIINILESAGFEAFAVGGCVRDKILGLKPKDWDITTNALPADIKSLFKATIDTGIKHGTVTVRLNKTNYEVTTYRLDGAYEDNRHPSSVEFTASLEEDLKRRDFTINAMAYNDERGLVDLFDGTEDLKAGIIRCVGDPLQRFSEDALRILRAFRFSARFGFSIDDETLDAAALKASTLKNISSERIREELTNLILSEHPEKLILASRMGVTKAVLPEYDGSTHCISCIKSSPVSAPIRWALLLHDLNEENREVSLILHRLKFDNDTTRIVGRLVSNMSATVTGITDAKMRLLAHNIGPDLMPDLFDIKEAHMLGMSHISETALIELRKARTQFNAIIERGDCLSLKNLSVNGRDLIKLGFKPGLEIGDTLEKLLLKVLENPEMNDKPCLLGMATAILYAGNLKRN